LPIIQPGIPPMMAAGTADTGNGHYAYMSPPTMHNNKTTFAARDYSQMTMRPGYLDLVCRKRNCDYCIYASKAVALHMHTIHLKEVHPEPNPIKMQPLPIPKIKPRRKIDQFAQCHSEWIQYKKSMSLNNSPLLPAIIKQTPNYKLNKQGSLHNPSWYEMREDDAIDILRKYAVNVDLNEVNNLELMTIKQNDKESIRSYVGKLESQA